MPMHELATRGVIRDVVTMPPEAATKVLAATKEE